jgi:hypothetical protein
MSSPEPGVDFPDIALKISSKGSADSRPERVELADDEFDEVNDLINSRTDAALAALIMTELQQLPREAALRERCGWPTGQALTESEAVASGASAFAWRRIICSMKL